MTSPVVDETPAVMRWVNATLTGDSTLQTLFGGTVRYFPLAAAPEGTAFPYLLALVPETIYAQVIRGIKVFARMELFVHVHDENASGAPGTAYALAARVKALLHEKTGANTSGRILQCWHMQERQMPEVQPTGLTRQHVIQQYHVLAKSP